MKGIFAVFYFLTTWVASSHDIKMGYFELLTNGKEIELLVRVDRLDILEAIKRQCSQRDALGECLEECFESYFNARVAFTFDGRKTSLDYSRHEFQEEIVEINFSLSTKPNIVNRIDVFNECLLELSDLQQNIVISSLAGRVRSFRLNKDRRATVIEFQ